MPRCRPSPAATRAMRHPLPASLRTAERCKGAESASGDDRRRHGLRIRKDNKKAGGLLPKVQNSSNLLAAKTVQLYKLAIGGVKKCPCG